MVILVYQVVVALLCLARAAGGMPDPAQRDLLRREEAFRQTGGRVVLTAAEQKLDAHLHRLKEKELSAVQFPPAVHFFRARTLIQDSPIFRLLQRMPKGNAGIGETSSGTDGGQNFHTRLLILTFNIVKKLKSKYMFRYNYLLVLDTITQTCFGAIYHESLNIFSFSQ